MRLAAIDIGTNSIHMIVVNVRADLSFEVVDQEKAMVRLGAGGLDGRKLTTEAMTAGLQALSRFRRLAESHGVEKILATATSAVREAKNGGDFLGRIASSTGIRPRVISGIEEARLIHLAAMYGVDVGSARAVVIDIGGGSVEITHGSSTAVQASKSFKLGAIRLTERFVRTDPLSRRDEQKLVAHIHGEIDRHCEAITNAGFDRVIGTSGTILSIGVVAATEARGAPPAEVRNLRVSSKQIRGVRKQMVALALRERLEVSGLDPQRADLVVAGSVLIDTILTRLGAPRSRCATSPCAKASSSTTSGPTKAKSPRQIRFPTSDAAARWPWPSDATTRRSMPSRSGAWRSRSSIRHGLFMD